MFQGFNNSTVKYFEAIKQENSKSAFLENNQYYLEGVKYPLEELYYELYGCFSKFDNNLLSFQRRCISFAYIDERGTLENICGKYNDILTEKFGEKFKCLFTNSVSARL